MLLKHEPVNVRQELIDHDVTEIMVEQRDSNRRSADEHRAARAPLPFRRADCHAALATASAGCMAADRPGNPSSCRRAGWMVLWTKACVGAPAITHIGVGALSKLADYL
jgi:hypothetical protein